MKLVFLLLVLVNVGLFAWQHGVFGRYTEPGREPERIARQIEPERTRVLSEKDVQALRERASLAKAAAAVATPADPDLGQPQVCVDFGDFPGGLKDLDTDNPDVKEALIKSFEYWIEVADFDGFRIDTVKHIDRPEASRNTRGFWGDFADRMRAKAKALGKQNFFIFGEGFDGNDELIGSYTWGGSDAEANAPGAKPSGRKKRGKNCG